MGVQIYEAGRDDQPRRIESPTHKSSLGNKCDPSFENADVAHRIETGVRHG